MHGFWVRNLPLFLGHPEELDTVLANGVDMLVRSRLASRRGHAVQGVRQHSHRRHLHRPLRFALALFSPESICDDLSARTFASNHQTGASSWSMRRYK